MKKVKDNLQLPFENEQKNLRKSPLKSEGNDLELSDVPFGTKSEQNNKMKGEFEFGSNQLNILKKVKELEEEEKEEI